MAKQLADALEHECGGVRLNAVTTLGQFGERAAVALHQLIDILNSEPDPLIRNLSIVTIVTIEAIDS